jgi:type II secretory pathway component PulF
MPTFTYQAKQGPTNVVEGTMVAANQEEVVNRLLQGGLVPVAILIKPEDLEGEDGKVARVRVRAKERRLFTRQLTSLLRAKLELVPAVTILKEQSPSRAVRALLTDIERWMREGNSLSSAIARHPRVFSPLFLAAIRAGEAAGKLDDILIKLVEFDEQQERLESRLTGAVAYPLMLVVVGLACLGFFLWVVVPRMAQLFEQIGTALPWPTKILLAFSDVMTRQWMWVVGALLAAALLLRWLCRTPAFIAAMELVLRRLPVAREVLEARQIGRFTRTLQLLLHSGLPVFQAMDVARPTLGSALLERQMREAQEAVKRGSSIADGLRAARCFPPFVTHMVSVGESAGTLVDVLDETASYYERGLDEMLRVVTSLLEPIMIAIMGCLVGFCVLAMVLPIFQVTQLVR